MTPSLSFLPASVRTAFARPMRRAADGNCSSPPTPRSFSFKRVMSSLMPVLVEELVELLVVDAVRAFNFPVQVWRPRADGHPSQSGTSH